MSDPTASLDDSSPSSSGHGRGRSMLWRAAFLSCIGLVGALWFWGDLLSTVMFRGLSAVAIVLVLITGWKMSDATVG